MPKLRYRFFWQLLFAFALVTLLVGGEVYLASRPNLNKRGIFAHDIPAATIDLWENRLAGYFKQAGSWDNVDAMIAGYPSGAGWEPQNPDWQQTEYVLAAADGTIVASSDGIQNAGDEHPGLTLNWLEQAKATPIEVNGQKVGFLLLSVPERDEDHPYTLTAVILVVLAVGIFVFVVGLARRISRPFVELMAATQAVSAGDLSVRVPVHYRGEMGELAVAFNTMIEQLARADELRRNLTADVAHELRTPLSVVRGKVEGVLDGVYPASTEHLSPVLDEIKLLTRLVEELHLLSLAEAGELSLEKRPMDIVALLRDAQVNFAPQAADREVTLALDLPSDEPDTFALEIMADRRRITQVLGNLLTNALRHTPAGGRVTMAVAVSKEKARVTVADTGTGISSDDLPHIFDRFWRGEKSRSRTGSGAGLGLAIAKHLIQAHGGEIGVNSPSISSQSDKVGKGTMFYFTLPLSH